MLWRPCALLLVILLGLAVGAPLRAEAPSARKVLRGCSLGVKPDLVGLDALQGQCPTLAQAIEDLGIATHLPRNWKKQVTPGDLADWSALADRYDPSAAPASRPDSHRLQTIAETLRPPPEPPNWWERFKIWLASWFDPEGGQWPGWLHWPSQWRPGKSFLYVLVGLVFLTAAVVVAIELRAAGVMGPGRRRRRGSVRPPTGTPINSGRWQEPEEIIGSIEQLRPEHLLRVLVSALNRSHRLERDRDLTCRELITAARFDTVAQREIFASVALQAEQILYGEPQRAAALSDRELGQSAQGLYGELLTAPAERLSK
jgi:hypothetical protein